VQDRKALRKVVLARGTGTLGLAIAKHLGNRGFDVVLLTRKTKPGIEFKQVIWDGRNVDVSWGELLSGSILINLAGELVDRVPTKKNIALLKSSRTEPSAALVQAAKRFGKPALWLQSSTLAIYGDAGDVIVDESSPAADGPEQMAGVAKAWEASLDESCADRVVWMRTAVVLQPGTPALNRLTTMTRLFLGGTVSLGRQWVSWIHYQDFLAAIDFLIDRTSLSGIVHIASPNPVTNRELMASLRKALHRPWMPPTPAFLVKLGAWLIFRTDPALALLGRRAIPKRLQEDGFDFRFANLTECLADFFQRDVRPKQM
jgi:uncharacterized protein (TIGR01777 family)